MKVRHTAPSADVFTQHPAGLFHKQTGLKGGGDEGMSNKRPAGFAGFAGPARVSEARLEAAFDPTTFRRALSLVLAHKSCGSGLWSPGFYLRRRWRGCREQKSIQFLASQSSRGALSRRGRGGGEEAAGRLCHSKASPTNPGHRWADCIDDRDKSERFLWVC